MVRAYITTAYYCFWCIYNNKQYFMKRYHANNMNEKRSKILFGFFSAFRMWMNMLNVPVTWNALTDTHGSRCALHGRKEISRTIADSNWGTHWTRQFKCRAIDQCALVVEIAQTHRNSRKSIYRNCRSFEQYSKAYIFYLFDFLVLSSICTGFPVMKYDRSHLCARSHNPASNSTSQKHTHTFKETHMRERTWTTCYRTTTSSK